MAKIILTHEVSGLGSAGDVVDVKNGYARNFLFPRGFATPWSRGAEKQIESIKKARAARDLASLEDAQALAAKLTSTTLTVPVKSGAEGRLFGTVRAEDVAKAVEASGLGSIDKRRVELTQRIKTTGVYQAVVRLHEEVNANV
ncbi:MAG: 50S ribosomal protein L9, partial [Kocuria sp.]|nr:50S ribosomal protein L9 [Kocuria sp.]